MRLRIKKPQIKYFHFKATIGDEFFTLNVLKLVKRNKGGVALQKKNDSRIKLHIKSRKKFDQHLVDIDVSSEQRNHN